MSRIHNVQRPTAVDVQLVATQEAVRACTAVDLRQRGVQRPLAVRHLEHARQLRVAADIRGVAAQGASFER